MNPADTDTRESQREPLAPFYLEDTPGLLRERANRARQRGTSDDLLLAAACDEAEIAFVRCVTRARAPKKKRGPTRAQRESAIGVTHRGPKS